MTGLLTGRRVHTVRNGGVVYTCRDEITLPDVLEAKVPIALTSIPNFA